MKAYLSIALLVSFCIQTAAGPATGRTRRNFLSPEARQKQKKPAPEPRNIGPEEDASQESIKGQAVAALKETIERSPSIPKLEERASVVSGAAELIWRYDEPYARAAFAKLTDELVSQFAARGKSSGGEATATGELTAALNVSLKALARKDPGLAAQVLERYQSMREDAVRGAPSNRVLNEKLSLAKESVEINAQQSAALAAKVIDFRVPTSFPQYLYDLAKQDSSTADSLYRRSLTSLSSGRAHSVNEAILLSTYAFKERMILAPMPAPRSGQSNGNEFGVFTTPLSPAGGKPDRNLTDEYLQAAYVYVTSQVKPGSPKATDPNFLGPGFFLVRKLRVYAAKLGADPQGKWQQLEQGVGVLSRNADLDQSTLDYLGGYADRLVADNNVFQFDGGASDFERANKTEDKEQRTQYLVSGIWNLIQDLKFSEAEDRIKEIESPGLKERLTDLLNYQAGEASLNKGEWGEFNFRAFRIKDATTRLLLLLNGARAATHGRDRGRPPALQHLNESLSLVPKVERGEDRAKALIFMASLFSSVDTQRAREVLVEAKKEINGSKAYDGKGLEIDVELPGMSIPIVLEASSLDASLKRMATTDWAGVKAVIDELDSASIRSLARIAACRAVL